MLKEKIDTILAGARLNFIKFQYVAPFFFGSFDGQIKVIPITFEKPQDKDKLNQQIQEWISSGSLQEFIMVSEAWMANINVLPIKGSLEYVPDRKEVVHILYCSPTEEIQYTGEIIRGTISSLSEFHEDKIAVKYNTTEFMTRFQGLFLKAKSGLN